MGITTVLTRRRAFGALSPALVALVLAACGNLEATFTAARATPTPTAVALSTASPTPTVPAFAAANRTIPLGNQRPAQTPQLGRALPDDRTAEIMALLLEREPDDALLQEAMDEIVLHRDVRFIAPLVELMRAGPMQLAELNDTHVEALQRLTGWRHSQAWDRWVEWYGRSELEPPPGFAAWKGELLSRLDDRYRAYFGDDVPSDIRMEQLVWSGTMPDAMPPPLDAPLLVPAGAPEAAYLDPGEPVFGVYVNGEARAYPHRIMDLHEIANDVVGGVPVTLAYDTLTGAATLYDRRAPDGQTYSFAGSGFVHESNRLMYDRETRSLWSSLLGRPVVGNLVEAAAGVPGRWLDAFPIVTARWEEWVHQHPDTLVLAQDTGFRQEYTLGFPHLEYFRSGDTSYPVSLRDPQELTKSWVYGLTSGEEAKAYPLRTVFDEGVVNDRIDDLDIVLVGDGRGRGIRVNGETPQHGEVRYFVGGTIRAFARPEGITFQPGPWSGAVVDQHGDEWHVTEAGLLSPTGEVAPRLFGQLLYWFGWHAFYPHTDVYHSIRPTSGP